MHVTAVLFSAFFYPTRARVALNLLMSSRKLCSSTRQPVLTAEPRVTPVPDKQWPCSLSHCTGVSRCLRCWLWNSESSGSYSRHEDPGGATSSALGKHTLLKARVEVPGPGQWVLLTQGREAFHVSFSVMSWRGLPISGWRKSGRLLEPCLQAGFQVCNRKGTITNFSKRI